MNDTDKVKWGRPVENKYGNLVYESKCGRFQIVKTQMCGMSSRNGHYTQIDYTLSPILGKKIRCDSFSEAKEWAQDLSDDFNITP